MAISFYLIIIYSIIYKLKCICTCNHKILSWINLQQKVPEPTPPTLHNTCEISYKPHLLPSHYIQRTQIECNCLWSLSLSTWRWPWIVPKHVVVFYVINNTYLFHQIVVLDIRYITVWCSWGWAKLSLIEIINKIIIVASS